MHLKEVVINGFKSFADRTRLDLEPGVIAIVGPNGCGKSNIADAIRWVLGEQSAKALRGGKMQDVIFDGADSRKSLNLCEVTLKFTNCEKQLGTAFHEVEIGRRVSRDGQSDYFLNGKVCRLKDIQRLFMDTGVGRVSYSFLVQGQIDQILSTNPADRRVIFEEAAGITKYKAQRRETMNKLNLVENNLARLTDVIEEVSRQIGSLKRQASKALRYKRLKHRLTHLDQAFLAYRYRNLQDEMDGLEAEAHQVGKELDTSRADSEEREGRLTREREDRQEVYDRMQEAQQRVYNLRSEKENATNRAEFAAVRRKDIEARISELEAELKSIADQREALARRAADDAQTKQMQLDLVGSSDEVFQEKNQELFEAQERLSRAENDLQDHKQKLLMLESNITRLRSNQTSLEVDLKTYQVKHGGMKDFQQELKNKREELETQLGELQGARERQQQAHSEGEERIQKMRLEGEQARMVFREIQGQIQSLDRDIARQSAHLQVLENLNKSFEGFGEGTRAILQDKLGPALPADQRVLLTENLQVEDAQTTAIEALLGAAKDTLVVESFDSAAAAIEVLEKKKIGRACFRIPLPESSPAFVNEGSVELPAGMRRALDLVDIKAESVSAAATRLFSSCYVVESMPDFIAFWQHNPGFSFYRVATPRGELLDGNGLLYGGHAAGGQDSFLKRQADIRKLKSEIKKQEKQMAELRERAGAKQDQLDKLEESIESSREQVVEMGRELSNLSAQEKSVQQALFQNDAQQKSTMQELETLEASHQESEARLLKAQDSLKQAETEIVDQRSAIDKCEEQIRMAREERDARRDRLADVRLQLAEKKQRLEAIDRNLEAISEKSAELHELAQRREQERDTLHEQIRDRDREEREEQARAEEIEKTLVVTREALDRDREAFGRLEEQVKILEKDLKKYRELERGHEAKLNKVEVRLAELRSQRTFLLDRAHADYQVSIDRVNWKQELWKADEEFERRVDLESLEDGESLEAKPKADRGDPSEEDLNAMDETDWSSVEEEVKALKERIQAMGPVNLVAIEEYADLSQRYKFLKEQSDDLWNSKEKLIAAIDEINQISQDLFRDTFKQVTQNFKYTYDQLTGGGFADLTLVDSDDVLDSGIEIIARPPGTKLKSISLLSGGQKTMTAVALLFAIYMVKPSPFCVLDELDAPLDDANIGRFTKMLKRFTEFSQFLIITHNKRTIAAANAIFGVTMPEKGVSRLISMRFDHDRGEAREVADPVVAS